MKKLFFFSFVVLGVAGFFTLTTYKREDSPIPRPTVLGTPAKGAGNLVDIPYKGMTIRMSWFALVDGETISLYQNFADKKPSYEVFEDRACKQLISGGFYTQDNKPVGLFISDQETLTGWRQNSLFNGILSINMTNTPRITRTVPKDPLTIGLQTGPIFIENDRFQKLAIRNDKQARRMVASITGENVLYFLGLFDANSVYKGPLLADVPDILKQFEKETGIDFADAINLDGGSASAFISDDLTLSEYSPVGSFFCIQ